MGERTEAMRRRSFFAAVRFFHLGLFRLERLKTDGPNRGWVRSSGVYVVNCKNKSHVPHLLHLKLSTMRCKPLVKKIEHLKKTSQILTVKRPRRAHTRISPSRKEQRTARSQPRRIDGAEFLTFSTPMAIFIKYSPQSREHRRKESH